MYGDTKPGRTEVPQHGDNPMPRVEELPHPVAAEALLKLDSWTFRLSWMPFAALLRECASSQDTIFESIAQNILSEAAPRHVFRQSRI